MQDKLAKLLIQSSALSALVGGTRIQWDTLPQGSPVGSISMSVVSGVVDYHTAGPSGLVEARVQFDCRAGTAKGARAIADALRARLSGFRGVFEGYQFKGCFEIGQRTSYGKVDAFDWFTDSRDFTIWWGSAA
jgi:hypothetical protein